MALAMDLITYATAQGGTGTPSCPVLARIANTAGCGRATLYLIAKGHKQAGAPLASRISVATDGQVSPATLRSDVFGPCPQYPPAEESDPDARRIVPVESA